MKEKSEFRKSWSEIFRYEGVRKYLAKPTILLNIFFYSSIIPRANLTAKSDRWHQHQTAIKACPTWSSKVAWVGFYVKNQQLNHLLQSKLTSQEIAGWLAGFYRSYQWTFWLKFQSCTTPMKTYRVSLGHSSQTWRTTSNLLVFCRSSVPSVWVRTQVALDKSCANFFILFAAFYYIQSDLCSAELNHVNKPY